jgi:alpha-galactosidase
VIAVDQDSLGVQGLKYKDDDHGIEVWVKPLAHGDWAVCFLNRSDNKHTIEFDWSKNYIADDLSHMTLSTKDVVYKIRDLWAAKTIGTTQKKLVADVETRDVVMVRLTRQ